MKSINEMSITSGAEEKETAVCMGWGIKKEHKERDVT